MLQLIMRRLLQATGAEVIHLGHNRSVREIVDCAIQEDAQGIALTSYQGGHLEYFKYMIDLATVFTDGVNELFEKYNLPWSINQLGARAEYRFAKPYPKTGTDAFHAADPELEDYLHVYLANRGIMLTPFHNMALMCPTTTLADVEKHHEVFEAAIKELVAG